LKGFSPWGLLIAGAVVGTVGLPVVRKGARSLAVHTVKGVLAVSEGAKGLSQKMNQEWMELVHEAKADAESKKDNCRERIHRLEVESVKKGMHLAERARDGFGNIKERFGDLVEEARADMTAGEKPLPQENLPGGEKEKI